MLDVGHSLNLKPFCWKRAKIDVTHKHTTEKSMAHAESPKMVLEIECLVSCMINIIEIDVLIFNTAKSECGSNHDTDQTFSNISINTNCWCAH